MSSSSNSQTDPVPHDEKADVRIDVRIEIHADVHIHVDDGPEDPSDEPSRDKTQQSDQEKYAEDEQTDTGANSQQNHPGSRASAPIVLSELALHPPSWPANGFADDDPATAHMVNILQSFNLRSVIPSAAEDFIIYPPKEGFIRPFDQVSQRRMADSYNYNFLFPEPKKSGGMFGKVDYSKVGLTIIIQALRSVVRNNGETMSFPSLSQHVDRLNASNGVMRYNLPKFLEVDRSYCAAVDPFTPEGVRAAAATLQRRPAILRVIMSFSLVLLVQMIHAMT